jgi:hypothetical protein
MLKQKEECKYQNLVKLIIEKTKLDLQKNSMFSFNVLVLIIQVVDDVLYKDIFVQILIDHKELIVKNIKNINNQNIIVDMLMKNKDYNDDINQTYQLYSMGSILKSMNPATKALSYSKTIVAKNYIDTTPKVLNEFIYLNNDFVYNPVSIQNNLHEFYASVFLKTQDYKMMIKSLDDELLNEILKLSCKTRKESTRIKNTLKGFRNLSQDEQDVVLEMIKEI